MTNFEWLATQGGAIGRDTILGMVEEGDGTDTRNPWCKKYTTDTEDCPDHGSCGFCRREWLESEHDPQSQKWCCY